MNEKKASLGNVLSLFLLLFFFVIVLFVLFAVMNINEYDVFPAVLFFSVINFLILMVVIIGGSSFVKKIGFASYTSICVVTVIFSLLQFVYLGFGYQSALIISYTLYQLIVLFIYLLIIIPIVVLGAKNKSE